MHAIPVFSHSVAKTSNPGTHEAKCDRPESVRDLSRGHRGVLGHRLVRGSGLQGTVRLPAIADRPAGRAGRCAGLFAAAFRTVVVRLLRDLPAADARPAVRRRLAGNAAAGAGAAAAAQVKAEPPDRPDTRRSGDR